MASVHRTLFGDHRDPTEELMEIFGNDAVVQGVAWGEGVLRDAGVSAEDQLAAIAALRKAEPRLGLKTATHLAGLLEGEHR